MTWRSIAQVTITQVEQATRGASLAEFRKALYDAYPFRQRENHPYKIWCDEQRKALARHPEAQQHSIEGLPLFEEEK
jgi:hypothetical protein